MMRGGDIRYDIDGRRKGIACGGIGNIHQLAVESGLVEQINERLHLLKRHLPYHESDHILNIAYNHLAGGTRLQDIELPGNDEGWLEALNSATIPDPTTAGDFLRRFNEDDILELMEIKNTVRTRIWKNQPASFRRRAVVNADGTAAPTHGRCKQGMDISYDGRWGYHPLIISLHNTREPLYIVNRPGNAPSHLDSAGWIDKSLDLVCGNFREVHLRGDTDFSPTENFDKRDKRCTFIFGMDAMPNLKKIAKRLNPADWVVLEKRKKYEAETGERRKPKNFKDRIVKARNFRKFKTKVEHAAAFDYRPRKCEKPYRMIVLRKTLEVTEGTMNLFDEVRWFFYITNDRTRSIFEMIDFYRNRSDHENDIDQLKNGVKALSPNSDSLLSNWALMVIASLAWDLKAWFGLIMSWRPLGLSIVRMEFKRFLNTFMRIPCVIIKTGRRIIHRIVGYNDKLRHVVDFTRALKSYGFT